jgi:two-component system sensor histidine kinase UhpB
VNVVLGRRADSVALTISDNGKGITVEEMDTPRSFGVIGMRERARALGGTLTITSAPGKGTIVEAVLPLSEVASTVDEP